ncbi:MAG: hypothetical protein AAFV49_15950, partial [Pseudomonadota bacterium]
VIANLAVYLAEAAFLPDGLSNPAWAKLALFAAALWLVFVRGIGVVTLVVLGAACGVLLHLIGLL